MSNKKTLTEPCSTVADEVMSIWLKANISMISQVRIIAKLKSLHNEHVKVSKNKNKKSSASQIQLIAHFTDTMNQLFDISSPEWESTTPVQEDRQFLIDQRGPRLMAVGSCGRKTWGGTSSRPFLVSCIIM